MEILPFSREHYLHFWNNWFFAKLVTNPISAAMPEFRMIAHAPCRATQALCNDLQITLIQSLITEIQSFFRWHYLHFWNNWFFAKLGTNSISAVMPEFRIIAHESCRTTQALCNVLEITLIESLITEIQPFFRWHYLHFWNNWFVPKLSISTFPTAMHTFRMMLHASCRSTQALSNDLQITLIESLITEIQPFFRWHYLLFYNNWFFPKLSTNPISVAMHAFRFILHASCRATQALCSDLQITLIQSLITEIQWFFRGHYLHFWNNWFFAKLGTNIISAAMRVFRIILHASSWQTQALSNDLQSMLI